MLFIKKFSVCVFVCFCLAENGVWVARAGEWVLYEEDFHTYLPKSDWEGIQEVKKKESLFFGFLKKQAAVKESLALGLNYNFDVTKKITARKNMLLVNEYYMRHFLGSVIPPSSLSFCKNNLKKEVFVKHILIKPVSGEEKSGALIKEIKNSLLGGESFESLAKQNSQDPSVSGNGGSLGWVSLGQTVPEFQDVVFSLCVGCVGVAETAFGFHVIQVDSLRPSKYVNLSVEEQNDFAFRFSSAYIKEDLKVLAGEHDSLLIKNSGVSFNHKALSSLVEKLKQKKKEASLSKKDFDPFVVLKNHSKALVLYQGEVLSGAWFVNKLDLSLKSNILFGSVGELKKEFLTVLLRDIALHRSEVLGLNKNYSFVSQFSAIKQAVLEKAFLTFLVESVPMPTKNEVVSFFNSTDQKGRSLDVAYKSIELILLKENQEKAKTVFFDSVLSGEKFDINKGWLYD